MIFKKKKNFFFRVFLVVFEYSRFDQQGQRGSIFRPNLMKPKFHGQSVFLWPLLRLWSKYEQKLTRRVQPKISSEDQSSDIFVDIFCTNSACGVVFMFFDQNMIFWLPTTICRLDVEFYGFSQICESVFCEKKVQTPPT